MRLMTAIKVWYRELHPNVKALLQVALTGWLVWVASELLTRF